MGSLLASPRPREANWDGVVVLCATLRAGDLAEGSQCDPGAKIASLVTGVCSAPWPEQIAPRTCTLLTWCGHTATCLQVQMTVCVPRVEGRAPHHPLLHPTFP